MDLAELNAVDGGDALGDRRGPGALGNLDGGGVRRGPRRARRLGVGVFVAPAPPRMRAITWPTATVSPASARISVKVPEAGAGTSASTLSVEISTIVSSASTASPTALAHSSTTPSVTDSPIAGMTISTTCSSAASGSASASPARPPLKGAISASTAPTWIVSPSAA